MFKKEFEETTRIEESCFDDGTDNGDGELCQMSASSHVYGINNCVSSIGHKEIMLNFIHAYRDSPVLWDTSLKEYTNKDEKNEAYDKLLEIYRNIKRNASREDVKKKINSLRTNFRKELRKIEGSRGPDKVLYEPKCWTFKEMSFLAQNGYSTENIQDDSLEDANLSITPKPLHKLQKRRKSENESEGNEDAISIAFKHLYQAENEYTYLAKIWATDLSKMDESQQIFAKKAINDILFEGQMGTLHRYSVQINAPKSGTNDPT